MEKLVETVDLNSTNQLKVGISEFKGYRRLDVRHFYLDGKEWKPTTKGINVSIDVIDDLRKAFDKIYAAIMADPAADV